MLCQVSEMLGKIEEISKETKELGGSSRDVRPAMAVAKFQPVLQRKQRGRMKKLVTILCRDVYSISDLSSLPHLSLSEANTLEIVFQFSNDIKCKKENLFFFANQINRNMIQLSC